MDTPAFPEAAGGAYVAVVWWALFAIALVSVVVTVVTTMRGPRRSAKVGLGLAVLLRGPLVRSSSTVRPPAAGCCGPAGVTTE